MFVPLDQFKRMIALNSVDLKIVFINSQNTALARLVRQPDQRRISEIDILIGVFLDIGRQFRVAADRDFCNC